MHLQKSDKMLKTKRNRIVFGAFSVVLMLLLAIGGTTLYLTDNDSATNTVTIGGIDITLVEPNWIDPSNPLPPNTELPKDPQIENTGNNSAVVFMTLEVPVENITPVADDGTK